MNKIIEKKGSKFKQLQEKNGELGNKYKEFIGIVTETVKNITEGSLKNNKEESQKMKKKKQVRW